MVAQIVDIIDPVTGAVVDFCEGPTALGSCPRVGEGVVPCAARLIRPPDADPKIWPLWVPPMARHCSLGWSRRAALFQAQAENFHARWVAGLRREVEFVERRTRVGDHRFTNRSARERRRIARWRWSSSPYAHHLADVEEECRKRAQGYLGFARQHPYRHPDGRLDVDTATGRQSRYADPHRA